MREIELLEKRRKFVQSKHKDKFLAIEEELTTGGSPDLSGIPQELIDFFTSLKELIDKRENDELYKYAVGADNQNEEVEESRTEEEAKKPKTELSKEVVWRNITRGVIERNFNKNTTYSIGDVASKLGINYVQAFRYIVQWMRNEGYKVIEHRH